MASARYGSLPFTEQIAFFRQKLNLPTATWTDIWEGQHARAFVVAGAMRDELLTDLREAVRKSIEDGGTLEQFRKDFDGIVQRHGWAYNGGRNWRTRVIYETNLRTSYAAGRYEQMKQVAEDRPYWRYRHNDSVEHPRPEHLAWNKLVLRHDDPWFSTHYPPNGWGCRCYVETLAPEDLARLGKSAPDEAPPIEWEDKTVGVRGPNPRSVRVPKGIDPGWGYNVGEAAFGKQLSQDAMDTWKAAGADAWELLTPGAPETYDRPARIAIDAAQAKLAHRVKNSSEAERLIEEVLGGDEAVFDAGGIPVLVNAVSLAKHIDTNRSEFLPLIPEVLSNPYEVWLTFERHRGTGKVVLRARMIKAVDIEGKTMLVIANAVKGMLEAWTFIPTSDRRYVEKQRRGLLLFGRD